MTPKKTLKKWFSNLMKPAQEHFAAWIDSYWHKSEQIPMSNIEGLSRAIENTVSAGQLLNHINDTNAHRVLFDELKRQIQAIQTILQVDDVNLDTLQEIVTELKSNAKLQELIEKKVNKEEGKGLSSNDFTNEHKQKLEGLQPTDVSGLLPKGGYDGTGQQLKEAINGLQTKMQQVETTLSVDDTDFDTLQEIVTQVKSYKNLETLLTSKVDKTTIEKLLTVVNVNAGEDTTLIHDKSLQLFSENELHLSSGEGLDMYLHSGRAIALFGDTLSFRSKKGNAYFEVSGNNIIFEASNYEFKGEVPFVDKYIYKNKIAEIEKRLANLEAKG